MIFELCYGNSVRLEFISGDIESCCVELNKRLQRGDDIFMVSIKKETVVNGKFELEGEVRDY